MENSRASKIVLLLDSIVTTVITIFFLLVIVCGVYCIWDSNQVYMDADSSNYTVYKPSDDNTLSFEELRKLNPDVFGWIEIYGTEIDYPLLQGNDNLEYVNTDVLKNYSLSGAIFLDSAKPKSFLDFKSVVYGHHMEQHKMFGDIDLFADESFFDEHKYGNIYYDEKEHGLEIFSYIECDAYDGLVYGEYEDGNEQEFIGQIMNKSKYYRDIDLTEDDHIVVLSTCDYSYTDGRMVLLARISDTKYNNRFEN